MTLDVVVRPMSVSNVVLLYDMVANKSLIFTSQGQLFLVFNGSEWTWMLWWDQYVGHSSNMKAIINLISCIPSSTFLQCLMLVSELGCYAWGWYDGHCLSSPALYTSFMNWPQNVIAIKNLTSESQGQFFYTIWMVKKQLGWYGWG